MKKAKKTLKTKAEGITLIALVVTIIVLLILAGISISMLTGENGILNKAKEAGEKTEIATKEEEEAMYDMINMGDEIMGTVPEDWDMEKISQIIRQGKYKAPIPKGYAVSGITGEDKISEGLVIYQGEETVTESDGDNNGIIDAQENRNQYVWVPVDDINSMVMCKENNKDNNGTICNIELKDEKLVCTTHSDSTYLVGRLYLSDEIIKKDGENIIKYCEPDFNQRNQIYETDAAEPKNVQMDAEKNITEDGLQNNFNEMANSVAIYGGFYISRYEIGENGDSKKNKAILVSRRIGDEGDTYLLGNTWYGLYETTKKTDTIKNVNMIWGSQYEQVIKFIGNEALTGHNNSSYQTNEIKKSGCTKPMKNICELEGNCMEWTMTSCKNNYRILRGGGINWVEKREYRAAGLVATSGVNDGESFFACHTTLFINNS